MSQQPKYRFGDKLKYILKDEYKESVITVGKVVKDGERYEYHDEHNNGREDLWFYEDELELYQEPQKKKLYAYKDDYEHVVFCTKDIVFITEDGIKYIRSPEYDIEYPESLK